MGNPDCRSLGNQIGGGLMEEDLVKSSPENCRKFRLGLGSSHSMEFSALRSGTGWSKPSIRIWEEVGTRSLLPIGTKDNFRIRYFEVEFGWS